MYDNHFSRLFDAYDAGDISRRHLIASVAGFATAVAAGPVAAAAMGRNHRAADEPDDPKKGADDAARATFSAIDVNHVALGVTDVGRSRDWYVKHLGLKVSREDRSSCFLQCSKRDFLALFKAKKSGLDHYCFSVPDYDAGEAMKKLKAAGLDAHRHGNRVYFDDPDGIEVQVAAAEHQA